MQSKHREYRVWGESGQFMGNQPIAPHVNSLMREVQSNPISQAEINAMLKGHKK
ncbi:MAG: hypothetical protein NC218_03530 [Acetobacter sp.]|nr:hypothetical protein [Acetobacter sp.]